VELGSIGGARVANYSNVVTIKVKR